MRLALVAQEYPPETAFGGIGTQNYAKAHGLAAMGHELYVISHSIDDCRHEYKDQDVRVIRIPGFDSLLPLATEEARWITYSTQVAAAIARLHACEPLDLVEFADWGSEAFVHLLNQADWNRIPSVIQLHGPVVMFANAIGWPDPQSEFYRIAKMMEETCLRRADAIYSSSRCSAEWCERYHGCEPGSIPVIHTGIDTDAFFPRDVPKAQAPTIIFVGKLERNKGVDVLVDAALELASEIGDLRLILLGRGNPDLISELGRKTELAGHSELLHVVGYVKQSELPEHLSQAHVFAAPSQYEGGPGFVYLEAMACGLPVIGCAGSGASEVIAHGETGFLVPPRDRNALADALRRLLTDAELRRQFGRNARSYVAREANRQTCLQRLEEFYASVALGRKDKEAVS